MKSLWDENIAKNCKDDLSLRVYSSQLLGQDDKLVLHGGGNTSVKCKVKDEDILYVKGSGWDLATIKEQGFAPVRLKVLQQMATLSQLSDSNMVTSQKDAMIDKTAPNPSVEAILHAIIPFKFVDHTHSDAVVTITSNKDGERYIRQIYPEFLVIPYVMPGFILAKTIYDMTKNLNWQKCNGIILLNHGIFTFDDDVQISYEKMIDAVSIAEEFLDKNTYLDIKENTSKTIFDTKKLQDIINKQKNYDVFMKINQSPMAVYFASQKDFKQNCQKGVLTPEHIIRTKRIPLVLEDENISKAIDDYQEEYKKYFNRFQKDEIMLNTSPNWAVIKDFGTVSFGKNEKEATIIQDINNHTMEAILRANMLGGFESIGLKDSFEMEYWELEQAKLKG